MEAGELIQVHLCRLTWLMRKQARDLSQQGERQRHLQLSDLPMNAMAHTQRECECPHSHIQMCICIHMYTSYIYIEDKNNPFKNACRWILVAILGCLVVPERHS